MGVFPCRIIDVNIGCSFERANAFLAAPENLSQWAAGLGEVSRGADGGWIARTAEGGGMGLRFTPKNEFGVLDHFVTPEPGKEIYIPMRVVRNGEGCNVALTLFRHPEMSEEKFAQDIEWVRRDLGQLKTILEAKNR